MPEVIKRTVNTLFGNAAAVKARDPRAVVQFMKMENKGVEVVTKEDGTDSVFIKGYASTPHIDRHNDVVEPSAFAKGLATYLKNPRLLLRHWDEKNIGNVTEANIIDEGKEETDGLYVKAEVIRDVDDCKNLIRNGMMGTLSIGFICRAWEERKIGEGDNVRIVRVITDLDLLEISVVDIPANPNAIFTMGKSISAFFKAVQEAEKAEDTQGAPSAPEAPKEEPKQEGDEAGNAGGNPAPSPEVAAPEAVGDGVEAPKADASAPAVEEPAQADPAPVATPADAELAEEKKAHEETKAALAALQAEKDAALASLAAANGDLEAARKAATEAEQKAKDFADKASRAQDDAEKAQSEAKALKSRARAGQDTAKIEKSADAQNSLAKACEMISFCA